VHRQEFVPPEAAATVEELTVDGGNIRLRTPEGEPCTWKGYKAVCLHEHVVVAASFQENQVVIDWVNTQPLAAVLTCIGDGLLGHLEPHYSIGSRHSTAGCTGLVSLGGELA